MSRKTRGGADRPKKFSVVGDDQSPQAEGIDSQKPDDVTQWLISFRQLQDRAVDGTRLHPVSPEIVRAIREMPDEVAAVLPELGEARNAWLEFDEAIQECKARSDSLNSDWQQRFGERHPTCDIDTYIRLAARAGFSGETIFNGPVGGEIEVIEGHLQRVQDMCRSHHVNDATNKNRDDGKPKDDTKSDTPKKPKKKRPMTAAAVGCATIWCKNWTSGDTTPMREIVENYVEENGGSVDSIMRTLNDNPDQWKKRK